MDLRPCKGSEVVCHLKTIGCLHHPPEINKNVNRDSFWLIIIPKIPKNYIIINYALYILVFLSNSFSIYLMNNTVLGNTYHIIYHISNNVTKVK